MDWQTIVLTIILNFVINGVVILLVKSIIDSAHDEDLANLKAELDKVHMIQTTQFADLHKRRAEAIAELYKLLVEAERLVKRGVRLAKLPLPNIIGEEKKAVTAWIKTDPIRKAIDDLSVFYEKNKILLSPQQAVWMDEIVHIFTETQASISTKEYHSQGGDDDKEIEDYIAGRLAAAEAKLSTVYPKIKDALESDFRSLLGFGIS